MKTAMAKPEPYTVLRDTREQHGWQFPKSDSCAGTESATLKTGDYTLRGFEDSFVVERKRSTGEFAANIFEKRFHRELERLDSFKHAFLVLEFEIADIVQFPVNSGIPKFRWSQLRVSPRLLMCKLHEIQVQHPTLSVVPVGHFGREFCSSLFKRIVECR